MDKSSRTAVTPVKSYNTKQLTGSFTPSPPGRPKSGKGGLQRSNSKSKSTSDLTAAGNSADFLVRRKDDQMLSNRDFHSFTNPKPRRSASPNRSMRRSVSPTRPRPKFAGNTTVESIPGIIYYDDVLFFFCFFLFKIFFMFYKNYLTFLQ